MRRSRTDAQLRAILRGWQYEALKEYVPLISAWRECVRVCKQLRDAGDLKGAAKAFAAAERAAAKVMKLDEKHRKLGRRIE